MLTVKNNFFKLSTQFHNHLAKQIYRERENDEEEEEK